MLNNPIQKDLYKLPIGRQELPSFATTVFEFSSDAMMLLDSVGKVAAANSALLNLVGDDRNGIVGKHPKFLFAGEADEGSYKKFMNALILNGYFMGQSLARVASGAVVPMEVQFSAIYNGVGEVNHYVGICSSIYAYLPKMNELPFNPNIDPLTRAFNANSFLHRLEHNLHKVEKDASVLSVVYIDVDRFKELDRDHNYLNGDAVLKSIGRTLSEMLDKSDTVARLKADIFSCIIQDVYTQGEISTIVEDMFRRLTDPFALHPKIESVSISIGVATYPISGET
ncbi:MAG: sensor domain-containing diguanylate cyclase, partial [Rickettsiales bacterium]|nr:sensor domain-containing diguanylate cyclase [Rickettsiales bacterium]